MTKVCAKLVPKNLTPDQKLLRQQVRSDFLERLEEDPGPMKNIITCDETWIFQYDVETKRQSMHWKTPESPRIKKARMSKSKFKAMSIVFFFLTLNYNITIIYIYIRPVTYDLDFTVNSSTLHYTTYTEEKMTSGREPTSSRRGEPDSAQPAPKFANREDTRGNRPLLPRTIRTGRLCVANRRRRRPLISTKSRDHHIQPNSYPVNRPFQDKRRYIPPRRNCLEVRPEPLGSLTTTYSGPVTGRC